MASMTAQGTLPTAGGDINAEPLTNTFNHIMNTYNGQNADENNVDYTSSDGIVVMAQAQTITGLKSLENTSAAAGGIRNGVKIGLNPTTGTPAANDGVRILLYADDAGGTASDIAFIDAVMTTATAGAEVGRLDFYVAAGAGSAVSQVQIRDGSFTPTTTDDISLGTVALNFSDLFLDLGAVINFDGGDVTLTHSANTLTLGGGDFSVGTGTVTAATLLPNSNDSGAIGASGTAFADLFLASGAVINFAAANYTITHAAGQLTFSGGNIFLNDTANGAMTLGLTLNQGVADDEILAFKSSDVSTGATTLAETNTFTSFRKFSATGGGLEMRVIEDANGANQPFLLYAVGASENTADTSTSTGTIVFKSSKLNGTGAQALGATGNILTVENYGTTTFLLKGNGDCHLTNTTLVALDDEDDIALIRAFQRASSRGAGMVMSRWDRMMKAEEEDLKRVGVLSSHGDFIVQQRFNSLIGGGLVQMFEKFAGAMEKLEKHTGLKLLEAA